jgi:hypothetical protein
LDGSHSKPPAGITLHPVLGIYASSGEGFEQRLYLQGVGSIIITFRLHIVHHNKATFLIHLLVHGVLVNYICQRYSQRQPFNWHQVGAYRLFPLSPFFIFKLLRFYNLWFTFLGVTFTLFMLNWASMIDAQHVYHHQTQ